MINSILYSMSIGEWQNMDHLTTDVLYLDVENIM